MAAGSEVLVSFAALRRAADDARDTAASLDRQLADLRSYLAPLAAVWEGSAAHAHLARQTQWDQAQAALDQLLAQFGAALERSHGNYSEARDRNAAMWS